MQFVSFILNCRVALKQFLIMEHLVTNFDYIFKSSFLNVVIKICYFLDLFPTLEDLQASFVII